MEKYDRNENIKGILNMNKLSCKRHGTLLFKFTVFDYK